MAARVDRVPNFSEVPQGKAAIGAAIACVVTAVAAGVIYALAAQMGGVYIPAIATTGGVAGLALLTAGGLTGVTLHHIAGKRSAELARKRAAAPAANGRRMYRHVRRCGAQSGSCEKCGRNDRMRSSYAPRSYA